MSGAFYQPEARRAEGRDPHPVGRLVLCILMQTMGLAAVSSPHRFSVGHLRRDGRAEIPLVVGIRRLEAMDAIARMLQLAGLAIPLLAVLAQLNEAISVGHLLLFLVASVCLFYVGHFLRGGGHGS